MHNASGNQRTQRAHLQVTEYHEMHGAGPERWTCEIGDVVQHDGNVLVQKGKHMNARRRKKSF